MRTICKIALVLLAIITVNAMADEIEWVFIDDDPGVSGHEGFNGDMSKYETTNAQYCEFLNAALDSGDVVVDGDLVKGAVGSNPGADFVGEIYFDTYAADLDSQITYSGGAFSVRSRDGYDMSNHPVVEVSWYGATAFCNYYGYRLPTEWEWQAVADYDGSYTYGCGTTISFAKANYYDNGYANPLGLSSYPYTSPVDCYSSYGYGMNDMAGNVWEWTSTVSGSFPVIRSGSCSNSDLDCMVSSRQDWFTPDRTYSLIGFRVCRDKIDMTWVLIDDPGVSGHEGFTGYMSKYETTNAQYCEYLNSAKAAEQITVYNDVVYASSDTSHSQPYFDTYVADSHSQITYSGDTFSVRSRDGYDMSNHPVVEVSWYGATAFCNYYGYRLPTEWEWQAVADFDGSYTYGCGTTIDHSKANYDCDNPLGLSSWPSTSPVNHYSPCGYGMNDMAGNVWEWTSTISSSYRVIRGGSWYDNDSYCTVSHRDLNNQPFASHSNIGFRVVMLRTLHVDTINGDDSNNGLSREKAFATIQEGTDAAFDSETVLVWPGVYSETVDFAGKAITVQSAADAAVITNSGGYGVRFHTAEGAGSVLANFVIRDCNIGIQAESSSPTIDHVTVVNNTQGIVADGIADPIITNSILWDNESGDLIDCTADYSCIEGGSVGVGNISVDPCFADPCNGNYHLKSEQGRFWPEDLTDPNEFGLLDGLWAMDPVTSPCIDDGNPMDDPSGEGDYSGGLVNMGAYGGTAYASRSDYYWPLEGDVNRDGIVNLADFAIVSENWLDSIE